VVAVENPLAVREYEVRLSPAGVVPLQLAVGMPSPAPPDVVCEYEITGTGRPAKARRVYGVDGIQALLLALMAANAELERIARDLGGVVFWLGGTGIGLPGANAFPTAPVPVDST
jgi:hypothetical protein